MSSTLTLKKPVAPDAAQTVGHDQTNQFSVAQAYGQQCGPGANAQLAANPQPAPLTKWEYCTRTCAPGAGWGQNPEAIMDLLGEDGWELACTREIPSHNAHTPATLFMYFKRPKRR